MSAISTYIIHLIHISVYSLMQTLPSRLLEGNRVFHLLILNLAMLLSFWQSLIDIWPNLFLLNIVTQTQIFQICANFQADSINSALL